MLADEQIEEILEIAQTAVERGAQTIIITQLIITAILAVSLKSMWNLMNVIQVLAYVRFFSGWPAIILEVFKYMDNAITLKPVSDPIFEYGQS